MFHNQVDVPTADGGMVQHDCIDSAWTAQSLTLNGYVFVCFLATQTAHLASNVDFVRVGGRSRSIVIDATEGHPLDRCRRGTQSLPRHAV